MQSFATPRPTTNPYIHMLDSALAAEHGVEHIRHDRRRALFGRYDVLHFHWPETLLGGSSFTKAFLRKLYVTALVARLRLTPVAVVRTVHNVELPADVSRWERALLLSIDCLTDVRIIMNRQTPVEEGAVSLLIPHGHYRDWFGPEVAIGPQVGTLGFVGLVRRYKGVEALIQAFAATGPALPDVRLEVSGSPSTASLRDELERLAAADPRVHLDLRFLSEPDFAAAIRRAQGVVLPYRFMHNSGAVLAALSLGRMVLVPDNDVNRDLADEVGAGWIHFYEEEVTPRDLERFARHLNSPPASGPDLSRREWDGVGAAHAAAYRLAVSTRKARRRDGR